MSAIVRKLPPRVGDTSGSIGGVADLPESVADALKRIPDTLSRRVGDTIRNVGSVSDSVVHVGDTLGIAADSVVYAGDTLRSVDTVGDTNEGVGGSFYPFAV